MAWSQCHGTVTATSSNLVCKRSPVFHRFLLSGLGKDGIILRFYESRRFTDNESKLTQCMGVTCWLLCAIIYHITHMHFIDNLTHWGRDEMDAISQTTLSNAFSWMKMFAYRLKFHWSLFLRVQLTISQHWFRWWLGADQATSHYLDQWWLDYRRIYASLGLNELTHWGRTNWSPFRGRHFQTHLFLLKKYKSITILFKFFPKAQLTIFQNWFR